MYLAVPGLHLQQIAGLLGTPRQYRANRRTAEPPNRETREFKFGAHH
jgi:hypothetical protein